MPPHYSQRLPADLEPTSFSRAMDAARQHPEFVDLTISNPYALGLGPSFEALREGLVAPEVASYAPRAAGDTSARRAIAESYGRRGIEIDPEDLILSASTSEAYAWVLKLLCDPGEGAAIPTPSYPLFESLLRLEGVAPSRYRLLYDGAWYLDRDSLAQACHPRCRAVFCVSPNNPTGSVLDDEALAAIDDICAGGDRAAVYDEVFADFTSFAQAPSRLRREAEALSFVLSGLSKISGLPQLKLGWIVLHGPAALKHEAKQRLLHIADSYLSVSATAMRGAAHWLALGAEFQSRVRRRVDENLERLDAFVRAHEALTRLKRDGGWYAILRIPRQEEPGALALRLLEEQAVAVQPGWLYDLPPEHWVLSLLGPPEAFDVGLSRMAALL